MARLLDIHQLKVVAKDDFEYKPEITEHDPQESYLIFNAILTGFEKMKKRRVENLTIALFESGPKGFVPGKLIEFWDCGYFKPESISPKESHFIWLERHYTRIDLGARGNEAELIVFKRIKLISLPRQDKRYSYLTKIFHVSGMDIVDVVKSMNLNGIKSIDLAIKIEEDIKEKEMR